MIMSPRLKHRLHDNYPGCHFIWHTYQVFALFFSRYFPIVSSIFAPCHFYCLIKVTVWNTWNFSELYCCILLFSLFSLRDQQLMKHFTSFLLPCLVMEKCIYYSFLQRVVMITAAKCSGRFDSPQNYAAGRFDSPLQKCSEEIFAKFLWLDSPQYVKQRNLTPLSKCGGKIWLAAEFCSGNIWKSTEYTVGNFRKSWISSKYWDQSREKLLE